MDRQKQKAWENVVRGRPTDKERVHYSRMRRRRRNRDRRIRMKYWIYAAFAIAALLVYLMSN